MLTETNFKIESAFKDEQPIPLKYTGDGQDISPPLKISGIPKQSKSLVLIVDDPDAPRGTFDHWIVWNISPNIQVISEGASEFKQASVKQGKNGFGDENYHGPKPPPGKAHRYYFKLYALDIPYLDLSDGSSKQQVEQAMEGHIISTTVLMGTYQRA
jgi:hypothetical protein